MNEPLRQRLLAAVFDDEVIGADLVLDLALSSDAHGELVRLATVLAGLPGRGARDAEARLDALLDQVSQVAASMSAMARGSDVMHQFAEPQPAKLADTRTRSRPQVPVDPRAAVTPEPRASRRIGIDRKPMLFGAGVAAVIIIGFLAWPRREAGDRTSHVGSGSLPASPPPTPAPTAAVREPARVPRALVNVGIRVTPSTATIAIDDVVVDGNPFTGRRMRGRGTHRIRVSAPGYISKIMAVEFNANVTIDLTLDRAAQEAAVTAPPHGPARAISAPEAGGDDAVPAAPSPPPAMPSSPPPADLPPASVGPTATDDRVQVMITTNVPGSEIAIDDAVVGTAPLREPLRVSPGRHKITVMHDGYAPRTRFVELDAANAASIEVAMTLPVEMPLPAVDANGGKRPLRPIDPANPYRGDGSDR